MNTVIAILHAQPSMPEKAEGEVGIVANTREATPDRPAQGEKLGGTEVGEIAPFDVSMGSMTDSIELRS